MTTNEAVVLTETIETGVRLVTLNRPQRLNALNTEIVDELHRAFVEVEADADVRVAILTGAGRGFCSGADLKAAADEGGVAIPASRTTNPTQRLLEGQEHLASLHERIHRLRKPVIAAVNGVAVGGGFTLALACDIRIAAEAARFGAVFITLGLSNCDMGSSYFLPRLVGATRAAELLLTGRIFDSTEAQAMGLVLDVQPQDGLLERAVETARAIAQHSPLGVWMTKETMWDNVDAPSLRAALDVENRTQVMCAASGGLLEAAKAFGDRAQQ